MNGDDLVCQAIKAWSEYLKGNPEPLKQFFEQTGITAYSFLEMLREYQDYRQISKLSKILREVSIYVTKAVRVSQEGT